ncbi:hypothetical protein GGQ03_003057 [Salinibacter ruber]|uniref:Uncharacterized protein n=1 Tax=Salinibacter ruber TaxID=146919 RepID=A0AAW5PBE4_9BACT|nr:hypothetical protein [Salinibacter ruber]MCS4155752.1 hypothetical protein [Salinibacter ruber]MCS4159232.1 hypothetical protein [Salinibacter ruber]MCS4223751.1 hypothetical protein [Salinibacter ruber]
MITGKQSDELPLPNRAGMMSGSENELHALHRVLPTLGEEFSVGIRPTATVRSKRGSDEKQDLDLLTPIKKKQETLSAAGKLYSRGSSIQRP